MGYFLIGVVLFGVAMLWLPYGRSRQIQAPDTDLQRKLNFIRDVCDGSQKKADALIAEKLAQDSSRQYELAVELVYGDMLQLTGEERAAILRHQRYRERRSRTRTSAPPDCPESRPAAMQNTDG